MRFDQERIAPCTMLQNAFARFKGEVQSVKVGVAFFQMIDHTQTLQVVLKAAKRLHAFIQGVLARMTKRGVS